MPNYFIVSTTDDHAPYLMLSQKDYNQTMEGIKHFEKMGYRHYYVFAVKPLPPNHYYPGVTQLVLEAHVKPDDMPGYYTHSLGHELDLLPQEQALAELQRALDYLDRKRVQIEGRAVQTESIGQSTGS
jgi:hypothetical protein